MKQKYFCSLGVSLLLYYNLPTLKYFIFSILLFSNFCATAQNKVLLDSLSKELITAKTQNAKIEILNELSWEYSAVDFIQAKSTAEKAIYLSKKISSKELLADSYNRLALAYDYKGSLDSALKYYNASYNLRREEKDDKGAANVLNNIGACYHYQSVFDSSLVYYMKALTIREKINDEKGLSESYNNVGIILRTQKEYEKAIKYYKKSLRLKEKQGNKKGMLYTYSNLSVVSGMIGENEAALEYSKNALLIAYELQDSSEIGGQLTNIGVVYNKLDQSDKALENLLKGNVILRAIGDSYTLSQNLNNLGDVYESIEDFENAIIAYEESIELAIQLNRLELKMANLGGLSDTYAEIGEYKLAWESILQYNDLETNVFSQDKSSLIADLETKYQSEKKQNEIIKLSTENQLQELKIESDSFLKKVYIIIVVIAFLVIMLILLLYRSKRKLLNVVGEKNSVIEKSLGEKETLLKEIHHRVKNNLQVISSLLSLQSRYIEDENASKAIEDSKNRVKSMALIHQKLYQKDNLKGVNIKAYIHELVDSLISTYKTEDIEVIVKAESIDLDVDTIIPIGLILNELITNSLKYGASGNAPKLVVSFFKKDDSLLLIVNDNGKGLPNDYDLSKSKSYGMKLIHSLSRKLKAEVSFENDNGLKVMILIKKFKLAV
ncbi:MAG: two-component sensor histidine kinase/Tfp pilus assembly protein PilF [Crocinitomix sp.]|jgi:two-component sensor histidine kinase/Tfp pilus assembly protein PilF